MKANAREKRGEAYAEKVRRMFAQTVNDILSVNKTMPELGEGEMFSFDGQSKRKQDEVEVLLRRLYSSATMAVKNGIKLEWEQGNAECDQMLETLFGKKIMENPAFAGWLERNKSAMNAFANRTENGFNLSKRIWKSVEQLREEMEVAMTVAIGEGESASSMSRKVRQYLNDPDLMFRRFRYKKGVDKDGKPVYGLKWKKRVKTEDGKYKFIDYDKDSYKVGRGYYKSSAKNAMRVTRTETNMAYRRADNKRWSQMEFVLGQHIEISHNHPEKDICDELKGDYPKDFVFDGWHPQCYCYCTPILMSEEEILKMMKAKREGKMYTPKEKQITELPDNFKNWVKDNAEKIAEAREKGTEPYFLRNNSELVDGILNPKEPKKLTAKEIMAKKHAERTPEQEEAIRKAWAEHNEKHALIKAKANNINNVAKDFHEIDLSALQSAIEANDIKRMETLTQTITEQYSEMLKEEKLLADLIPDVHEWHKKVSLSDLKAVYSAVQAKLATWENLSLEQQVKKLVFEANDFLGGNMHGVQQKFPNTWMISQASYLKRLDEVNYSIAIEKLKESLKPVSVWSIGHPKSKNVAALLKEANESFVQGEDIGVITEKTNIAIAEYKKRLAEQARRDKKKGITSGNRYAEDCYSQERKDAALWAKTTKSADDELRELSGQQWIAATEEQKEAIYRYTGSYHNIQEPLRGIEYIGSESAKSQGETRIKHITDLLEKCESDKDVWFQRGDSISGPDRNPLAKFGISYPPKDEDIAKLVGKEGIEPAFWSMGVAKGKGFSGDIIWNIYLPKGSKYMYIEPISMYGNGAGRSWDGIAKQTSFGHESEALLQRGSRMRITKVEKVDYTWFIDVEVVEQSPVAFPYVNGIPRVE